MNQIKKFLFDNFVIDDDEEKETHEETCSEHDNEYITAEDFAENEKVHEVITPEIIEPEVINEPEPEPITTYTQEELDKEVRISEQNGYEKGYKSAKAEIEAQVVGVLAEINNKLMTIVADTSSAQENIEKQYTILAKNMLQSLVPTLLDENAAEIVNKFIADNFKNFQNEAKLSFYIHPDIISYVQENIAKLANSHDFEGKIALHKDAKLGLSDCRVEWDNGGVCRSSQNVMDKMDELLKCEDNV